VHANALVVTPEIYIFRLTSSRFRVTGIGVSSVTFRLNVACVYDVLAQIVICNVVNI